MIKPEEINEKSRLIEKQWLFMRLVPKLIMKAHELGFELSGGDLYRDPRVHGRIGERTEINGRPVYGHRNSAHKAKLAIDLNLFRFDIYLEDSKYHAELGEYWKSLHTLCRWGGDFTKNVVKDGKEVAVPNPDGNHYSLFHNGFS